MMENGDLAAALIDTLNDAAINKIRQAARSSALPVTGHCYYCDEDVKQPLVFCDALCRDDWEREQTLRRNAGKHPFG